MAAARMMRALVAVSLACALLLVAAARVFAGSEAETAARAHYATGLRLAGAGEHERALVEFEASYRLAPYAGLLFNIAECADKLGRTDDAIARYEQYLAAAPRSSRREAVQARVATLRASQAKPNPPPPEAPPPTPPAPKPVVVAPVVPAPAVPAPAVAAPAVPAPAVAVTATPSPRRRRPWVWAVVGVSAVVVAGVAIGVGVGLGTRSNFDSNVPDIGPRAP